MKKVFSYSKIPAGLAVNPNELKDFSNWQTTYYLYGVCDTRSHAKHHNDGLDNHCNKLHVLSFTTYCYNDDCCFKLITDGSPSYENLSWNKFDPSFNKITDDGIGIGCYAYDEEARLGYQNMTEEESLSHKQKHTYFMYSGKDRTSYSDFVTSLLFSDNMSEEQCETYAGKIMNYMISQLN